MPERENVSRDTAAHSHCAGPDSRGQAPDAPQMHAAGCPHDHSHTHDPAITKSVLNRLARAAGHLEAVRRMVEDGRDCSDVLIQLAAVRSALNNTGILIMQDHIEHCIVDAVQQGDQDSIEKLKKAFATFF